MSQVTNTRDYAEQSGNLIRDNLFSATDTHSRSQPQQPEMEMDPQWSGYKIGSYLVAPSVTGPLRPVLCSVPGDLTQEWDHLKTQVFPQLDSLCRARGTCFKPVDIQWDALETDQPSDHVCYGQGLSSQQLKTSLDLISGSSSFLCLLSHRYGPFRTENDPTLLPGAGLGHKALPGVERNLEGAAKGGYPWVLRGGNKTCSLTELQITQAALMGDDRHCFFYFKDYSLSEKEENGDGYAGGGGQGLLLSAFSKQTEEERHRARQLKNRVVDSLQPVRFFRTLQELEDLVKRDWSCLIGQLYGPADHPSSCHLDSLDRRYHEGAVQALCRRFVFSTQANAVLEALNTFTSSLTRSYMSLCLATPWNSTIKLTRSDSERSVFLLSGERGCGKSTLAAWWLQEFRKKNPEVPVIPHFCGISNSSVNIVSVLRQMTAELRQAYYGPQAYWSEGLHHGVKLWSFHAVVLAFSAALALGPCVLVLDGLDSLTGTLGLSMQEVKDLCWLPASLPPQCKMIIITTSTDLTHRSLTLRPDVLPLPWPGLSEPWVRRSILLKHLSLPCQEPPKALLQSILGGPSRPGPGRHPLFLAVIASELQTCSVLRGELEVEELMEEYVEVDSMAELWARVIQRWIKDCGRVTDIIGSHANETGGVTSQVSQIGLRGWLWDALCLVHLSHAGLTEEQVLALLEVLGHHGSMQVLALEWARFRSAAGPWVQERPNGMLSLTHQSLGQALDLLLLRARSGNHSGGLRRTRRGFHLSLAQFFQKQAKVLCGWSQVLEELPWHLEQCEAWEELHSFFTDPQTLQHLSQCWSQCPQLRMDVVRYWTILIHKGHDPYTSYQILLGEGCRPSATKQSEKSSFFSDTCTDADSSELRGVDSNGMFMTESQREGQEDGCLWESGRVGLMVSELLLYLNREVEAVQILLQAEATLTQHSDSRSVRLQLTVLRTLAELYVELGQPREAEAQCRLAPPNTQTLTSACLEEHEGITLIKGQLLCILCQLLFTDDRALEASKILSDVISMGHHKRHPSAGVTVSFLRGIHKHSLHDSNAAEKHLQVALMSGRRWYGGDHSLVVEVEECMADIWTDTVTDTAGLKQVVELYQHAVHVKNQDVKLCSPTSPFLHAKGCSLAFTLVKLGRLFQQDSAKAQSTEALGLLQRALDLYMRFLGSDHKLTRDLQQFLSTQSRRPLTPLRGYSHLSKKRQSNVSRPYTATPLPSGLAWGRVISHVSQNPSGKRSLSAPSKKTCSTQPELEPEQTVNQNDRQKPMSSSLRTWSSFQATVFGPQSDISNLISELKPGPASAPGPCSIKPNQGPRQAGWCHLPARYLLEERTVTALNKEIGSPQHTRRCPRLLRQTGQGQGGEQSKSGVNHSTRRL